MMALRPLIRALLMTILSVTLLSACVTLTSPSSQLYTLNASNNGAPPLPEHNNPQRPVLAVGPVDLPDYLRRPQIVSREGENRIKVAEFDRWAAPLNEQVERVLAENLGARMPGMVVVNYREQRFKPRYRLSMSVERFERQDGKRVQLAGRWTLANAETGAVLQTHRDSFDVSLEGDESYEATVAAQSKALAELADAMSDVVRGHVSGGPSAR